MESENKLITAAQELAYFAMDMATSKQQLEDVRTLFNAICEAHREETKERLNLILNKVYGGSYGQA